MATQKSTRVTNADASPRVVNTKDGSTICPVEDFFTSSALVPLNDVVILDCKVPVDAKVTSVEVATSDGGTTGAMSVGVAKKNDDGTYTVVSANCFATDLDVNAAAVAFTERRHTNLGINTVNQPLYTLASVSARPDYSHLFIACTFTTATTGVITVATKVKYVNP